MQNEHDMQGDYLLEKWKAACTWMPFHISQSGVCKYPSSRVCFKMHASKYCSMLYRPEQIESVNSAGVNSQL